MRRFTLAHANLPAGRISSDCAYSAQLAERLVLVVADGAGGTTHGREAARVVIDVIAHETAHAEPFNDAARVAHVLQSIEQRLTRQRDGQTTAVCVSVGADTLVGASAGDSEAWWIDGDSITRLTEGQDRKPLLGAGARVRGFARERPAQGTLVVASDGLFSYVSPERIVEACRRDSVESVTSALVEAARLPLGRLQDDLAMFVMR